jgi:hypothetical protein
MKTEHGKSMAGQIWKLNRCGKLVSVYKVRFVIISTYFFSFFHRKKC